jgi:hypothetical protein
MPDESKGILWLKYFLIGILMGIIIEVGAALLRLYDYQPGWVVIIFVLVLWGAIFGSIALATRNRGFLVQYIPGFILIFGLEFLNYYVLKMWIFSPATFLYKFTTLQVALAIGFTMGFLAPVINLLMKIFKKLLPGKG